MMWAWDVSPPRVARASSDARREPRARQRPTSDMDFVQWARIRRVHATSRTTYSIMWNASAESSPPFLQPRVRPWHRLLAFVKSPGLSPIVSSPRCGMVEVVIAVVPPPPRRCPPFCRPSLRRHPRCLPNKPMPYTTCASRRYGCPRVCPACFALSSLRTPTHPPTQTTNHHRHHQRQGSSGHKPTRIRALPPPYPRSASVRNSPLSHIRLLNSRNCARISTKHSSTAATVYDGPWTAPQVARV